MCIAQFLLFANIGMIFFKVDIDEILRRAETREQEETGGHAEELLSAFKVVSLENLEEEWEEQQREQEARLRLEEQRRTAALNSSSRAPEAKGNAAASSNSIVQVAHNDASDLKDWADIIPEEARKKLDEQEEEQRLLELHLGPRQRKQYQPVRTYKYYTRTWYFYNLDNYSYEWTRILIPCLALVYLTTYCDYKRHRLVENCLLAVQRGRRDL